MGSASSGVAVLHFSILIEVVYRFSITSTGCKHKVITEKRKFAAGTHAVMRIVLQPSGATSGAALRQAASCAT